MYELTDNSVWVESDKLYREDGVLIKEPSILFYKKVLIRVGDYTNLFKEMLELEISLNSEKSDDFEFNLLNLHKYPKEYFNIDDACYVIRRCSEFIDDEFVENLIEKYGNVGFLEWLENEKVLIPIQVRKD